VFGNWLVRNIFGLKKDARDYIMRNFTICTPPTPNITRVIKSKSMGLAGHVARMGHRKGAYWVLVSRSEGKRPLGRPRHKWNILK
jgi:hypothetical protein